jgi:hypothetical protein
VTDVESGEEGEITDKGKNVRLIYKKAPLACALRLGPR